MFSAQTSFVKVIQIFQNRRRKSTCEVEGAPVMKRVSIRAFAAIHKPIHAWEKNPKAKDKSIKETDLDKPNLKESEKIVGSSYFAIISQFPEISLM